ncbi:MAG: DUF5715 family protein [Gemmatimonadota bacterium]
MRSLPILLTIAALAAPAGLHAEDFVSLRGSPASMQQQNRVAKQLGLDFYRSPAEIRQAAAQGVLTELEGNDDYEVAGFVSYPYLHPALALFVERLARQYREACGQKLVVTSGVRPTSGQPANSHALSVHPAGMAVDLRVSDRRSCRDWMDNALLNLEREGVLNGTREYRPPHYHVAVYPSEYVPYAQERIALEELAMERKREAAAAELAARQGELAMAQLAEGASALIQSSSAEDSREGSRQLGTGLAMMIVALPIGLGLLVRRRLGGRSRSRRDDRRGV